MKRFRTRFIFMAGFLVIGAAALVLYSCGGGGGGSSTPPAGVTGTKSAGSGAAAVQNSIGAANLGLGSLSGGGFTGKPSFRSLKQAKAGSLKASVAGFYKGFKAYKAKAQAVSALATTTTVTSCVDGSVTTATDNIQTTTLDLTTGDITITYTNCTTDLLDGTEEVQNGPISFSLALTGINLSLGTSATHYTDTVTRTSDSRLVFATDDNLTVIGAFGLTTPLPCTSGPVPSTVDFTVNGTSSDKEDFTVDGTLDINESDTFTNLGSAMTVSSIDPITCEPSDYGVTETGSFALVDNLDVTKNFSLVISSSDPLVLTVTSATGGENTSVSGTFTVTSDCFTGTLTVATTTPLFTPTGASCPTSGVITVTGDVIGTVTYTSTGGVHVDDGTTTHDYTDCNEAEACV